ncbi:MAG: glycosyltransferase [Lachnospiraceae bacterium]|nr:glycosyltransferase [Lachnospiraceae bacterium]
MSKRIDMSDIRRTFRYMKRNGLRGAYFAAKERMKLRAESRYSYICPDEGELANQRNETRDLEGEPSITVVIPAYEPNPVYFRKAVESVINQSYPHWRLVITDGSPSDRTYDIYKEFESDPRITYVKHEGDSGISANTNTGIEAALAQIAAAEPDHESTEPDYESTGSEAGCPNAYIGFLDHDDELTPDALYHMAKAAMGRGRSATCAAQERLSDESPVLVYSDEDKMSEPDPATRLYFDPHTKYDFNFDLLLSNNYICHFMMVRADVMQNMRFRSEYDGAQDYDLALRIAADIFRQDRSSESGTNAIDLEKFIAHVPRILYHWRSHTGSTATNTESKRYAYEAGLRALTDAVNGLFGALPRITHSKHLGFYDIDWGDPDTLFSLRPDVGAVIGRVLDVHGRMKECIYDKDRNALYAGLNNNFSGEFNRFDCAQDVYSADIKHVIVRPELKDTLQAFQGRITGNAVADSQTAAEFAIRLHDRGYRILYLPHMITREKRS